MFFTDKIRSKVFKTILLLVLTVAFIYINWPFLFAFIIAAIFALGLTDFTNKICAKLRLRKGFSVVLILAAGFAVFWVPIGLAINRIILNVSRPELLQTDALLLQLNHLKEFFLGWLQKVSSWTGMDLANPVRDTLENLLRKTGEVFFNFSSQLIGQLPTIALQSFVFTLLLLIFLLKSDTIYKTSKRYLPLSEEKFERILKGCKSSCYVTLFSTFVIGLIQALVVGIGSLIFREGDFWLVVAITFFVSFIPFIGAAPIAFILAILAFIGDRTGSGIGMCVVGLIAGSIDNAIKPFMVGKENKINPVIGFTCVVGAIIMLGLPGLLIGPVVMNLFVGLTPVLLSEPNDSK